MHHGEGGLGGWCDARVKPYGLRNAEWHADGDRDIRHYVHGTERGEPECDAEFHADGEFGSAERRGGVEIVVGGGSLKKKRETARIAYAKQHPERGRGGGWGVALEQQRRRND